MYELDYIEDDNNFLLKFHKQFELFIEAPNLYISMNLSTFLIVQNMSHSDPQMSLFRCPLTKFRSIQHIKIHYLFLSI